MALNHQYIRTLPGILKIICLIFNLLAIYFIRSAENPYYAANDALKFDAVVIAAICFTAICLLLIITYEKAGNSLKWQRNELIIQLILIIVYVYVTINLINATIDCHKVVQNGCPRQLTATIAGIAAVITYIIDDVLKFQEYRKKLQAQRIGGSGDVDGQPDDNDEDVNGDTALNDDDVDIDTDVASPSTKIKTTVN